MREGEIFVGLRMHAGLVVTHMLIALSRREGALERARLAATLVGIGRSCGAQYGSRPPLTVAARAEPAVSRGTASAMSQKGVERGGVKRAEKLQRAPMGTQYCADVGWSTAEDEVADRAKELSCRRAPLTLPLACSLLLVSLNTPQHSQKPLIVVAHCSTAMDAKLDSILRERCERVLRMGHHGFGAAQAAQCRLADIEVEGVKVIGEGETVSGAGCCS